MKDRHYHKYLQNTSDFFKISTNHNIKLRNLKKRQIAFKVKRFTLNNLTNLWHRISTMADIEGSSISKQEYYETIITLGMIEMKKRFFN